MRGHHRPESHSCLLKGTQWEWGLDQAGVCQGSRPAGAIQCRPIYPSRQLPTQTPSLLTEDEAGSEPSCHLMAELGTAFADHPQECVCAHPHLVNIAVLGPQCRMIATRTTHQEEAAQAKLVYQLQSQLTPAWHNFSLAGARSESGTRTSCHSAEAPFCQYSCSSGNRPRGL